MWILEKKREREGSAHAHTHTHTTKWNESEMQTKWEKWEIAVFGIEKFRHDIIVRNENLLSLSGGSAESKSLWCCHVLIRCSYWTDSTCLFVHGPKAQNQLSWSTDLIFKFIFVFKYINIILNIPFFFFFLKVQELAFGFLNVDLRKFAHIC